MVAILVYGINLPNAKKQDIGSGCTADGECYKFIGTVNQALLSLLSSKNEFGPGAGWILAVVGAVIGLAYLIALAVDGKKSLLGRRFR